MPPIRKTGSKKSGKRARSSDEKAPKKAVHTPESVNQAEDGVRAIIPHSIKDPKVQLIERKEIDKAENREQDRLDDVPPPLFFQRLKLQLPTNTQKSELRALAAELKGAVDDAVEAFCGEDQFEPKKQPGALGSACESFTSNAQQFARRITGERIRRYSLEMRFLEKPSESNSFDDLEKKEAVSETIRSWLRPWNLGFQDNKTGAVYQLFAKQNGQSTPNSGSFSMSKYGSHRIKPDGSRSPQTISTWREIVRIVAEETDLRDVTNFFTR